MAGAGAWGGGRKSYSSDIPCTLDCQIYKGWLIVATAWLSCKGSGNEKAGRRSDPCAPMFGSRGSNLNLKAFE